MMTLEERVAALEDLLQQVEPRQTSKRIDELDPFSGTDSPADVRFGVSNMTASTSEQTDGDNTATILNGIVVRPDSTPPVYGKMNSYPDFGFCDISGMADGQAFAVTVDVGNSVTVDDGVNFWDLDNFLGPNDRVWVITRLAGTTRFLEGGVIPPAQPFANRSQSRHNTRRKD